MMGSSDIRKCILLCLHQYDLLQLTCPFPPTTPAAPSYRPAPPVHVGRWAAAYLFLYHPRTLRQITYNCHRDVLSLLPTLQTTPYHLGVPQHPKRAKITYNRFTAAEPQNLPRWLLTHSLPCGSMPHSPILNPPFHHQNCFSPIAIRW